jgi:hypothetical protein
MYLFCQFPFADNFFFIFFYLTAKRDVVEEDHTLFVSGHSLPTGDSENVTERRRERDRERQRERDRDLSCVWIFSVLRDLLKS